MELPVGFEPTSTVLETAARPLSYGSNLCFDKVLVFTVLKDNI
jgi:hypothetical protein